MESRSVDACLDPEWFNFFRRKEDEEAESLERLLGKVAVFGLLEHGELSKLAKIVHLRHFEAGEIIIRRGVEQSGFYLIHRGSVHIVRERGEIAGTLEPPELLGEFALLDNTPRSSWVVAAGPSELIGFFKSDLMDILITEPRMGCKILLRLAEGMSRTLVRDYRKLRETGYLAAAEVTAPREVAME